MSSQSLAVGDKIPEIQVIQFPTDQIDPSPFQARKHFDQTSIQELGESIREHGVLLPLIARVADPASGRLELVAGDRRRQAALLVGLQAVPVIVRELSATAAEEIMLIENLQREDLTESEEANGYNRMLKLKSESGEALYTVETLAQKLGKNIAHVTARLKLLMCPKELVAAVDEGIVRVTTAMLVGRIPDPKARAECAREVLTPSHQQVPLNYEQTKELIRSRYIVRLDKKDFPLDDPMLVPMKKDDTGQRCLGGACTDCPFRSGNLEGVEAKESASTPGKAGGSTRGADPNMCTLPKCHRTKMDAAWRQQKEQAQMADRKVLDGEAAKEAFAGHNGELAFDGDYVNPVEAVNLQIGSVFVSKSWKDALKDSDLKTVLARHPETRQVMQLYDRAEALEALRVLVAAEEAQAKLDEKTRVKTDEEEAREAAEKQARAKEKEQAEVDGIAVKEAVTEVINGVTAKGVALDFYSTIFQMALTHSGPDGMLFLGRYLEIDLGKGTHSGRDYESEIIRIVEERAQTANAWMAYIEVALFARQVKWNGIGSDDLESCLKQQGIKISEIKRRAEALYKADRKLKNKKPAEAPPAQGTSTDPVSYSTDKEVELSAAADQRAREKALEKETRLAWAVNDKESYLKALLEEEIEPSAPNEHGVFVEDTEFVCAVNTKVSMCISLAKSEDGRWAFGYTHPSLGGRGAWQGDIQQSRVIAVNLAAKELLKSLSGGGARSKKEVEATERLRPVLDHIIVATTPSGPSESEKLNGVQDSKLGKPGRFDARDVAEAAKCLAAETTSITTLIGPKPKPADKPAYNAWSRVRMQLLRAAKKEK